jgi:hypothetical protein
MKKKTTNQLLEEILVELKKQGEPIITIDCQHEYILTTGVNVCKKCGNYIQNQYAQIQPWNTTKDAQC